MIDGYRMGEKVAKDIITQVCLVPGASIETLAHQVYQSRTSLGDAHIWPEEGFVQSFVEYFKSVYRRFDATAVA
jgi:hypothetical protein